MAQLYGEWSYNANSHFVNYRINDFSRSPWFKLCLSFTCKGDFSIRYNTKYLHENPGTKTALCMVRKRDETEHMTKLHNHALWFVCDFFSYSL